MNQSRSDRRKKQQRKNRVQLMRMARNTFFFAVLAIAATGIYLIVDKYSQQSSGNQGTPTDTIPEHTTKPQPPRKPIATLVPTNEPTVKLTFAGDIMMSGKVETLL